MTGAKVSFVKYHGAGNDFVCIDDREGGFEQHERAAVIARLCDRHYGIGADGLILLRYANADSALQEDADRLRMVYYNKDGAPSSFCGNGSRCFLKFALDLGLLSMPEPDAASDGIEFLANDGWHTGWVLSQNRFRVSMRVAGGLERLSTVADRVDTGSPHYVEWCQVLPEGDITAAARAIRYGAAYAKTGINVNYALDPDDGKLPLRVRTYERGVEGETQACGTGVTAVALSFAERRGLVGSQVVKVETLGGSLQVTFVRSAAGACSEVTLAGEAVRVFGGEVRVGEL